MLYSTARPWRLLDFEAIFGPGVPCNGDREWQGRVLLIRARALPERGFLGLEWANKICQYAADRMVRWNVGNVRLMRADASHLVRHSIRPESLTLLHIYHPDPWPKKRHHKRRLIQPPFLAAAVNALQPGGRIALPTDHAETSSRSAGAPGEPASERCPSTARGRRRDGYVQQLRDQVPPRGRDIYCSPRRSGRNAD